MTPWLRKETPPSGPPMPGMVDAQVFTDALSRVRSIGVSTPADEYVFSKIPVQELDQWGNPLPLAPLAQDTLNRIFAIIAAPQVRGTALLHSGQLIDDEVDAIEAVFPDIYVMMVERAKNDMLTYEPPYPAWVEAQLGILFRKPAATVYRPEGETKPPEPRIGNLKRPDATQADRRELSVREGR